MENAPNHAKPTARRWATAVLGLTGAAVVAACSSSGITSSGTQSAPPASSSATHAAASGSASGLPCAQITALRTTLTDLSHTSLSPTSAPRLASDLVKAEQQLAALKSQGTGTFSAQASQLSNALNAIKTDAAALANSPTPTNIANLTNAVTSFKTTAEPIIKEMQTACP
jgi:hypothetical protein